VQSESSTTIGDAIGAWLNAPLAASAQFPEALNALLIALVPAVPLALGQKMLADKARSEMYREHADGRLEFLKDNSKTLVTTRSIFDYRRTQWRPLGVKPAVKKSAAKRRRRPTGVIHTLPGEVKRATASAGKSAISPKKAPRNLEKKERAALGDDPFFILSSSAGTERTTSAGRLSHR
jgi:hypothetical protein